MLVSTTNSSDLTRSVMIYYLDQEEHYLVLGYHHNHITMSKTVLNHIEAQHVAFSFLSGNYDNLSHL